ncbi:pseudouridine synthase [Thermodesulfatator indicus DSM 15286]|uniref:Pseudouridine synthase n=1 Tax=Thermodesulfatator indicus (strain DSM 15286 / JCM 11887 / CIR29812) TaxID=667014 RepID=F8A8I0_THEID|nr:RluA family pseudouridine synthase [Thermodesulfatator indicus]AEH45066.1 pseudouridine synthase [Thermodesulfatator indicus DSM 15286]
MKDLIIYEDNHLLVVEKPGGLLVQGDSTGDITLLSMAKEYLKEKYQKPGNVYLGVVHRLDRVTSGVVIFARTSKAAQRLAKFFREKLVKKHYLAVVHGSPPPKGLLEDKIAWDENKRKAYISSKGKEASLVYLKLRTKNKKSLLLVQPITGRKHQIRVQLAKRKHPIVGDVKYGSKERIYFGRAILLHAWRIVLPHPVKDEILRFEAGLPFYWPKEFYPPAKIPWLKTERKL